MKKNEVGIISERKSPKNVSISTWFLPKNMEETENWIFEDGYF